MRIEFLTETRGYLLTLEQDLFGAFVLSRRWYGLANNRGGMKIQVFLDKEDAMREFKRVARLRARRGYRRLDQLHR